MTKRRGHIGAILCVLISGCSTSSDRVGEALLTELAKQRMTPIRQQDPYSTAHLFLQRARASSPQLDRILTARGLPITVSATNPFLATPSLTLLYAEEPTPVEFEKVGRQWVATSSASRSSSIFSGVSSKASTPDAFQSPATTPPPPEDHPIDPGSLESKAGFLQRLAASAPSAEAELSPRGDLVHYVTLDGESLHDIALWYTFDGTNTGRLARINQLPADGPLAVGDQVVVPSYLVRNKKRLSERALAEIRTHFPSQKMKDQSDRRF